MARVTMQWTQVLEDVGNAPGAQTGDVLVALAAAVDGMDSFTCASGDLTAAAEAGNVICLSTVLEDGRHIVVPWSNVAGIIDAPVSPAPAARQPKSAAKRA
jgi:hypothetical protein